MYRERNLVMQFVLYIITLGIYGLFWFYSTADEMIRIKGIQGSAILWTILLFIPFINLFAIWKHAETFELATDGAQNKVLMWLVALVFFPAYWLIVQTELNKRSGAAA